MATLLVLATSVLLCDVKTLPRTLKSAVHDVPPTAALSVVRPRPPVTANSLPVREGGNLSKRDPEVEEVGGEC